GFVRALVGTYPDDPGESQRHPTGIARTALDIAVGNLDDDLGTHDYGAVRLGGLQREQPRRHLLKVRIRQPLEGFADLDKATRSRIARGQVVVGEPAVAPSVTPLSSHDHQVKSARGLDFEPSATARTGCVVA